MSFPTNYGFERLVRTKLEVEPIERVKPRTSQGGGAEVKPHSSQGGGAEVHKTKLKWTLFDLDASMARRNFRCRVFTYVNSPLFALGGCGQLARLELNPKQMGSDELSVHVSLVQPVLVPIRGEVKFTLDDSVVRELVFDEKADASEVSWGCYDIPKLFQNEDRVVRCVISLSVALPDGGGENSGAKVEDFGSLLRSGQFSDVTLRASDGREFAAHRNILAARSSVFEARFELADDDDKELDMADVSAEVLEKLLGYVYTGRLSGGWGNPTVLLQAAAKYGVDDLKAACGRKLCAEMSVDSVVDKLRLGDRYRSSELFEAAVRFIERNWEEVSPTEKWKNFKRNNQELAFLVEVLIDT